MQRVDDKMSDDDGAVTPIASNDDTVPDVVFNTHYDGTVIVYNSARIALVAEQESDKTLNGLMAMAEQNKGNLYFKKWFAVP